MRTANVQVTGTDIEDAIANARYHIQGMKANHEFVSIESVAATPIGECFIEKRRGHSEYKVWVRRYVMTVRYLLASDPELKAMHAHGPAPK